MMSRYALTLAELVVVVCILAALGGLLVPLGSAHLSTAAHLSTQRTLVEARAALEQYWLDTRLLTVDGVLTAATPTNRFDLQWLSVNPVTGDSAVSFNPSSTSGWNGPYLFHKGNWHAGSSQSPNDGWRNELVVQVVDPTADVKDVRIVSAGADGVVNTPSGTPTSALTLNDVGDDMYVTLLLR